MHKQKATAYFLYLSLSLLLIAPIMLIFSAWHTIDADIWQHISRHALRSVLTNTALLLVGVNVITAILGVITAGLVTMTEFPGRKIFQGLFMFSFVIPSYVFGFIYVSVFDSVGVLQNFLRNYTPDLFLNFRNLGGLIFVFSLALYPYVYLFCRQAFITQGRKLLEAGNTLGHSPISCFFRIILPISKPWLLGALTLVSLETLADFGTVSIFAIDTFTTEIYKSWTGFFSLATAQQLASVLLIIALSVFLLAEFFRTRRTYAVADPNRSFQRIKLHGFNKWIAIFFSCTLTFCTTVLPSTVLVFWTLGTEIPFDHTIILNSAIIALGSGTIATVLAIVLSFSKYLLPSSWTIKLMSKLLVFGYAIPGTVLAVSVLGFFTALPDFLPRVWQGGSLLAMFFALAVRYTAVFTLNLNRALHRIPANLRDASYALGHSGIAMFRRVHLPLLMPSICYTFMIVVIETLKEMPITLMTRPFGWDTLAVKIFEFTSEGQWDKASYPSLLLVLLGIVPVYFFSTLAEERAC